MSIKSILIAATVLLAGVESHAISGGVEATTRDLPFIARIAAVKTLYSESFSAFECTAQYVSENTLVTAAHCVAKMAPGWVSQSLATRTSTKNAYVYRAVRGKRLPMFIGGMNRFAVKAVLVEKRYRDDLLDNPNYLNVNLEDKAIIIMDRKIRSRFLPVSVQKPQVGQRVLMAGYGFTRFIAKSHRSAFEKLAAHATGLHFGTNTISQRQRNGLVSAYYKIKKQSVGDLKQMPKRILTTEKNDVAALEGDSGSALIGLDQEGRAMLVGVFSRTTVAESYINNVGGVVQGSQYATFMSQRDINFLEDAKKFGGRVYFSDEKKGPNLKGLLKYISPNEAKKFKLK